MLSCPASTELRRCSNAGCLELTKALPQVSILITISTNTRLGSTAVPLAPAGSFFTA